MARCFSMVWCLILVVAFLDTATAEEYELVWKVPESTDSYANWTNQKFEIGDVVRFSWTEIHNVANVSKAEYESCTNTSLHLGNRSPVNFTFNSNGTYYFICTIGSHCSLGQKVTLATKDAATNSAKSLETAGLSATFLAIVVGLLY